MLQQVKNSIFWLLLLVASTTFATHNRAGEITYRQTGAFTYEITIVTYTKMSSQADRPKLYLNWGDNTADSLNRVSETPVGNDTKRNLYTGTHTYPGADTYTMWFEDPNRNGGVLNIPNSINVPFYIQTTLVINPFLGFNSSPILLNPPIDDACVDKVFIHNPGAYDADGDSISYKLVECRGEDGLVIPGYSYPNSSNSLTLNPITGDLIWDSPEQIGEYNVAILIEEWRNGILIGSITRDMQIKVFSCNNNPPNIATQTQLCITAGDNLLLPVTFNDIDNDHVSIQATGGPFLLAPAAQFPNPITVAVPYTDTLRWQTDCAHVRKQPYQVTIKALDNATPINLVDLKTVQITVVGPAPVGLTVNPAGNNMVVKWGKHTCTEVTGYKIYRRIGFYGFVHANCETGVPAYTGYSLVATTGSIADTIYTDNNNGLGLAQATDYCYMIVAVFPDGAESYASAEVCNELVKDIPVLTNVSVKSTNIANGTMYTAWSKPTQINTTAAPGPYLYLIYRANGFNMQSLVLLDSLQALNDTIFNDTGLNTLQQPYTYRIDLINNTPNNRFLIGSSTLASSVYLSVLPADNQCQLSWQYNVPWNNTLYEIYRKAPSQVSFTLLDTTSQLSYIDTGLANGEQYCYYVKSIGGYSSPGYISPIINLSEEACASPIDTVPPCPPIVAIESNCDEAKNTLHWNVLQLPCANEIVGYKIYYKPFADQPFQLLVSLTPADTIYLHQNLTSVAGCYYVTATDSAGNESAPSLSVCADNCPNYSLPNVFTPNNDGKNDVFQPFPYKYVQDISIKIFNRWGALIFETTNPDINWKGTVKNGDKPCSTGTYYYVCEVHEIHFDGVKTNKLAGFITLFMEEPVND